MEIHFPYNISSSVIFKEPKHLHQNGNTSNKEHSELTREHLEVESLHWDHEGPIPHLGPEFKFNMKLKLKWKSHG